MEDKREMPDAQRRQRQRSRRPTNDGSSSQTDDKRQRTKAYKPRPIHRPWTLYAPPRSAEDPSVPLVASTFRFMSFNVLADYLVINDRVNEPAKRHQKYDWEYRSTRLMREISRWSPHIVNLQEVDHFEDFFEPKMKNAGFVGVYKRRTGDKTHDGCAIFVRKSMFRIVSSHPIEYHVPDHPVLDRDNIALTAVVETKSCVGGSIPARFVVANTHLLFNPNRGEIKLAQLDMLLKHLTSLRQENASLLPVLLSGDFNLAPHSPLYHFLSTGKLDASGLSRFGLSGQNLDTYALKKATRVNENDRTRHHGNGTAFGKFISDRAQRSDFRVYKPNTVYSHELDFASAYAQLPDDKCTGEPKFTIFHSGSKGTVDYIWYTRSSLHCHGVVEMIPAGLLFKYDELPTTEHSSDHLSLVADFSLR
ncbi:Endonuclease/Exonuclease/phosphatase family [Phytophthora infestans]|uniref:Endonuclease/Exonuclease/phosphatase family n=1 Tax=Phytophthora infestans TaxID=4787 RepID=A0A8S9TIZ5_PHYIN|nr:Endonuclease/Exonuclease/phosphatase family [Phytophthora infestans]